MRFTRHLNGSAKSQETAQPEKAPFSDGSGSVNWPVDWNGNSKLFTALTHTERRQLMTAKRVLVPAGRAPTQAPRHG